MYVLSIPLVLAVVLVVGSIPSVDVDEQEMIERFGIGRYGEGNIDLFSRPQYINPDSSVSTVRSMSFEDNGKEILVPTIAYGLHGQAVLLTDDQAIDRYYDTGEYLGKFKTVAQANDYADRLHDQQEAIYG